MIMARGLLIAVLCLAAGTAKAGEVYVAVAANFTAPARDIAQAFETDTSHRAKLSFGGTGKLYGQIRHGAPFQILLAADQARPIRAENEGLAVAGSRFTYAVGKLVLYSTDPDKVDAAGKVLHNLRDGDRLAIANPRTAPYGAAAVQVLEAMGVYEQVAARIVMGENIAQTFQFIATGNATLGFAAQSQLIDRPGGSRWQVPEALYQPIRQDAALLQKGADSAAAKAFLAYLQGEQARRIIQRYGYGLE